MPSKRDSFFPKADATIFQSKYQPPSPASRPIHVAPIFDIEHADKPLRIWSADEVDAVYPSNGAQWAPASIPARADCPMHCAADRYLFPILTRNERLRLTMLFYHTRGAINDQELMSHLQEKVFLAQDTVGWEFVIVGLLDHNTYTRMVTVGLPLAILPRRESTCAHTVNQPPGMLFSLLNMSQDWRFEESPHVAEGGLRAYVGVPLRYQTQFGQHVAFGSLCVASNSPQDELSIDQQRALVRLADWIVADIVLSSKVRRQREQRRMADLAARLQSLCDTGAHMDLLVVQSLEEIYPTTSVTICKTNTGEIPLDRAVSLDISELDNGLWEDSEHFEQLLTEKNHAEMVASRAVRAIAIQCTDCGTATFLVVSSKDFRLVFDDVDSSFVRTCAEILSRCWRGQALKEALDAKASFLRGITHQLRTPIHGILGSVELLTEDLKSLLHIEPTGSIPQLQDHPYLEPNNSQIYIDTIRTSARELISTVNSLIKLNQWATLAETGRASSVYSVEEIETTLIEELAQARSLDLANRPSVFFRRRFPQDCDSLTLNLQLFKECIQPLITNAVQSTLGGVVAVIMSLSHDSRSLTVDVEDNGHGIDIKNHERIFVAYEKVDIHTTGAGLGLTLSCKAAMLQNGQVTLVRSEIGQGSHFRAAFTDLVRPSSSAKQAPIKERLRCLPTRYHRVQSESGSSLLGDNFEEYLQDVGFIRSTNRDGTLLVFDYASGPDYLDLAIRNVPKTQVGICLVPENASDFQHPGSENLAAQGNVLYIQGPFLPRFIEQSLTSLDTILAKSLSAYAQKSDDHITGTDGEQEETVSLQNHAAVTSQKDQCALLGVAALSIETPVSLAELQVKPLRRKPMTLLVDDNAINLRLLELYCRRRDIPYRTAVDGGEAVRTFEHHRTPVDNPLHSQLRVTQPFDLVLMDLQMPVCDGIAALRQIRALEVKHNWEKSIVFIVTGQDSLTDRDNAAQAGTNGYLVKPVGPKELDRWISQWFL